MTMSFCKKNKDALFAPTPDFTPKPGRALAADGCSIPKRPRHEGIAGQMPRTAKDMLFFAQIHAILDWYFTNIPAICTRI
jgi:hypothetical protein